MENHQLVMFGGKTYRQIEKDGVVKLEEVVVEGTGNPPKPVK